MKKFFNTGLCSLVIALIPIAICFFVYMVSAIPFPQLDSNAFNIAFRIGFAFVIFPIFAICLPMSMICAMRVLKNMRTFQDLKQVFKNRENWEFFAIIAIFLDLFYLFSLVSVSFAPHAK